MIAFLRMLLGSGCVLLGAVMIAVALRQYRREMTWRRTGATVLRRPGMPDAELLYLDEMGRERLARHWGVRSTIGTGARVRLLVHPGDPDRIAMPVGASALAVLAVCGIAVGMLGLLMLANAFWT